MVAVQHGKLDWEVALHWLPLTPGKARSLLHCLNKLGCPFFIGILQCPSHPFAACPLWAICHGHETIHEGTKANGPAILLGGCVFCSYDGSIRCFSWLDVPPPPKPGLIHSAYCLKTDCLVSGTERWVPNSSISWCDWCSGKDFAAVCTPPHFTRTKNPQFVSLYVQQINTQSFSEARDP